MKSVILAIESSCDETAASIGIDGRIMSNIIATQNIHEKYGGVVPELASRQHLRTIVRVVDQALTDAGITKDQLTAIAFTQGPGLMGSLLVGATFAKGLTLALDIPLIGIHHMKAHILSHFIEDPTPEFPFLCLTVSGGHTQIVVVNDFLDMKIIGETLDDAVGETFDKAAKLLGLPYPGGPFIDKHSESGNPEAFKFPKPNVPGFDFSFSGIKTAFLYFLRDEKKKDPNFIDKNINNICASIQFNLVEILLDKLKLAVQKTGIRQIAIAGGVSANSELQKQLQAIATVENWEIYIPRIEYCTDNAAMIAIAAHYKLSNGEITDLHSQVQPRMNFEY